jgi:hypothetical protein
MSANGRSRHPPRGILLVVKVETPPHQENLFISGQSAVLQKIQNLRATPDFKSDVIWRGDLATHPEESVRNRNESVPYSEKGGEVEPLSVVQKPPHRVRSGPTFPDE